MNVNRVTFAGRIGADGVLKYTSGGTAVMELDVCNNKRKGETFIQNWLKVVIWGRLAEEHAGVCKKGVRVIAEGELETREWESRGGGKRSGTQLRVDSFGVLWEPSWDAPAQEPNRSIGPVL